MQRLAVAILVALQGCAATSAPEVGVAHPPAVAAPAARVVVVEKPVTVERVKVVERPVVVAAVPSPAPQTVPLPAPKPAPCVFGYPCAAAVATASLRDKPGPRRPLARGCDGRPVDVNTATAAQLRCVPGIGEKRAQAIVAGRASGRYKSAADLKARKILPAAAYEKAAPHLR